MSRFKREQPETNGNVNDVNKSTLVTVVHVALFYLKSVNFAKAKVHSRKNGAKLVI